MPQAENAKAIPVGTGAGSVTSTQVATAQGSSARSAANLSLPPRRSQLGQGDLPSGSLSARAEPSRTVDGGAPKACSATPRLAELFGRDTSAPAPTPHPLSPHAPVVETATHRLASGGQRPITRAKGGDRDGVIIGISVGAPPADSQYIRPEQIGYFLAPGKIGTNTSYTPASTPAVPVVASARIEAQVGHPAELQALLQSRSTVDGTLHLESRGTLAARATPISTLKQALRELTAEKEDAHAPRELQLKDLIPGVVAATGSSNLYVQDAARCVLAILNDYLQGIPVCREVLLDAERRINRVERGAGTAPAVGRGVQLPSRSDTPLLHTDLTQQPLGRTQRLLQLGRESLSIVNSLHGIQESQGRNPKYTPEHLLSRVTQVMAATVARHVTALSNQLRSESLSIALHLTELSRSLSAIASRPGRVDLRAFSLRLEGLLLVLKLHMQLPRHQTTREERVSSSSELCQHISNHLESLYAHRTGRRPAAPGSLPGQSSDNLIESTHPTAGLLVELLVSAAPGEPDHQSPNARSAAEQLAMILRATSL
jgi:hypothetical protein